MSIYAVLPVIRDSFLYPVKWLTDLFNSIPGAVEVLLAAFFIVVVMALFVIPLRGAGISVGIHSIYGGSDRARKSNGTKVKSGDK